MDWLHASVAKFRHVTGNARCCCRTAICPASPVSGQLAAHYRREKASAQQQAAMQTQQESQQYSRSATNASNRQSSFKHEPPASPSSSSDTRSTYSSAAPCLEVSGQGCEVSCGCAGLHVCQQIPAISLHSAKHAVMYANNSLQSALIDMACCHVC